MEMDTHKSSLFSLLDLPPVDVVFAEIFPRLSLKDLFSLRTLSTSYKDLVDSYFPVCQKFDFSTTKSGEELYKYVTQDNHSIRVLNLANCKHWLTDELLLPVITRNQHLAEINLTECSRLHATIVDCISENCCDITRLSLCACSWIPKESLKALISKCNKLEVLDLEACWGLDDSCVQLVFESCPRLKYLNISRIYSLTPSSIDLIRLCPDIVELNFNSFWRLENRDISKVMEFCPKLRIIHLKDCTHINQLSLIRLTLRNIACEGIEPPSELGDLFPTLCSESAPALRLQT